MEQEIWKYFWTSFDFTSMPGIEFMVERYPLQHDVLGTTSHHNCTQV
jgi:hypothetical protein